MAGRLIFGLAAYLLMTQLGFCEEIVDKGSFTSILKHIITESILNYMRSTDIFELVSHGVNPNWDGCAR